MGYGLWPYRIDLKKLTTLPRPGSPAFVKLERKLKKRFGEIRPDVSAESETPAMALAKIAAGKLNSRDEMHGRVVEAVVATVE